MSHATEASAALDERVRNELLPELEVVRTLGTGATANVYLARETALQRLVAVKVLRPAVAEDAVLRQRFEREAQSAARIVHAHVTAVHRVGHLRDGAPYIVMEYVEGRTLSDAIGAGSAMPLEQARSVLGDVASALAAAHDKGIVHRDVRPGNILLDRSGRAVLGDFGIAGLLESGASGSARLTAMGVRLGDARYMSPEQIRGDAVLEQSDVYSFGILACELLTGSHPYQASGDAQMMVAHLQQEPRKLRALRGNLDPALAALIDACMARDPNRRPLARDVVAQLNGSVTQAGAQGNDSALGGFLHELKRRKVYQVVVGYGALALATLGFSQAASDAQIISSHVYRAVVAVTLACFPLVAVLSWVYDIRRGSIERTRSAKFSRKMMLLIWATLAIVVAGAAIVAWLLLRPAP